MLTFEPKFGVRLLTLRAMPVAARKIDWTEVSTIGAEVQLAAEVGCTAGKNVANHATVRRQHPVPVFLEVGRTGRLEDFCQIDHGQSALRVDFVENAVHQVVNRVFSGLACLSGEMSVDLGGAGTTVTKVRLDNA